MAFRLEKPARPDIQWSGHMTAFCGQDQETKPLSQLPDSRETQPLVLGCKNGLIFDIFSLEKEGR